MTNKNKIVSVALVVLVAIVVIVVFMMQKSTAPTTPGSGNSQAQATGSITQTRAPAPVNVVVPSQGETTTADVAAPQIVSPANAHTSSDYRSFSISADNNKFTPSTVIVNQGDVVNIVITAVDKNYDFTQPDYGFKQVILKGQSKTIQFGATASGQFTFYCASCGGPSEGPTGYIIVAAK